MKRNITRFFGAGMVILAIIASILEALHSYELIESHLPLWFVSNIRPEHTLILATVGILLFFADMVAPTSETEPASRTLPSDRASIPEITQTANPTLTANPTINIHNYPTSTEQRAHVVEPVAHNAAFEGASRTITNLSDEVSDDSDGMIAVKACFSNRSKPGVKVANLNGARASVMFKDEAGNEVAEVQDAVWMGSFTQPFVDIPPNGKKCLILAIYGSAERSWFAPVLSKRTSGYWEDGDHYEPEIDGRPLKLGKLIAEINVVGDDNIGLYPTQVALILTADGEVEVNRV